MELSRERGKEEEDIKARTQGSTPSLTTKGIVNI
jgi:hypothetical protein